MQKRTLFLTFGTAVVITVSSVSVYAMGAPYIGRPVRAINPVQPQKNPPTSGGGSTNQSGGSTSSTNNSSTQSGQTGTGGKLVGGPIAIKRLAGKPLNVCKGRQKNINVILARVVKRGTNQMNFFNSVTTKVEGYVTTNNLTVPNYSTLVATINSDQATVQADVNALKANDTFNCNGNNPTNTALTIKSELKQEITDLQTYRQDIKSLIVAVKAVVQSSSSSSSNSSNSSGGNQ